MENKMENKITEDKIKIISNECKFNNWLKVNIVNALLPNNMEIERDIVQKGNAVVIVALTDDNQLFLVKQPRLAHLKLESIELPAGMIEEKHKFDPLCAAKAELEEETGCDANRCEWYSLGKFIPDVGSCTTTVYLYLAKHAKVAHQLHLDNDEYLECFTIPFNEAVQKVKDFNNDYFSDAAAIISIIRAEQLLKE